MNIYTLDQLVACARSSSPFYRQLYADLPSERVELHQLPIAPFDAIMKTVHEDYRALFASDEAYGMYYTTSGTTGRPKATLFGRDEWHTVNQMLANLHWKNGTLRSGDIVCSLSEPGSASFMAIHGVIQAFPGRCSEIPIGCDHPYDHIVQTYRRFGATVIAGMNPTLLGLAAHLLEHSGPDESVRRLLGGGELMLGAQPDLISEAFPNAKMCSFMYGAAEAGMIGYSYFGLLQNEFLPLPDLCNVEIVDTQTQEPIREVGVVGSLVVTNFVRLATPVLRFMTGDYAMWCTPAGSPSPRFSIHGRMFPFQHVINEVAISNGDIYTIASLLEKRVRILGLQMVISSEGLHVLLEARVWLHNQEMSDETLTDCVASAILRHYPALARTGTGPPVNIIARRVPTKYFEALSRRKAKYIIDTRRCH